MPTEAGNRTPPPAIPPVGDVRRPGEHDRGVSSVPLGDSRQAQLSLFTEPEAREHTDRTRASLEESWRLIVEGYERGVHTALGYDSWRAYAVAELGYSQSRAYQMLDHGRVMQALEASVSRILETPNAGQSAELAPVLRSDGAQAVADTWSETVERSNGKPTATDVKNVVEERKVARDSHPLPPPPEAPPSEQPARRQTPPAPQERPKPAPKPLLQLRTHKGDTVDYPKPSGKATFNESTGSGISWAAWSWNPVTGCLHGCNYCYARDIANNPRYASSYPVGFTPLFHNERLDAPSNTVIPERYRDDRHEACGEERCKICAYRRVFVCSMADLYGRWVPDDWIDQVHSSMLSAPRWEYLLLTKFPSRYVGLDLPPNAWVGTSVDEQNRVRIAETAFRQIEGVKVKWLSLEPLLAPLEFTDLSMFDWVVIGAQTATNQPTGRVEAFSPDWRWVLDLTQQAIESGCKIHWKPNLRTHPGMTWPDEYPI